jgi:hypothetical protein
MSTFKIYKYEISPEGMQSLEMPHGAQPLDVQVQLQQDGSATVVLWALVMPEQPKEARRLAVVATGDDLPAEIVEKFSYVKTFQTLSPRMDEDGEIVPKSIVFHVFLERSRSN